MTYLQLVNAVLKRMRENTVATVTENALSTLVGEFVNDAKRVVEDAWQWQSLFDYVDVPLLNGTSTYQLNVINATLSGAPLRSRARPRRVLDDGSLAAYLTTSGYEAQLNEFQYDAGYNLLVANVNQGAVGVPDKLALIPSSNVLEDKLNKAVVFSVTPDRSLTSRIFFTNPQEAFTAGSEVLLVPEHPVKQLAYLYCLYERGEELGEMVGLTEKKADQALLDAIQFDQALQSYSPTFYTDTTIPKVTLNG